jgi:hypothetical protein
VLNFFFFNGVGLGTLIKSWKNKHKVSHIGEELVLCELKKKIVLHWIEHTPVVFIYGNVTPKGVPLGYPIL